MNTNTTLQSVVLGWAKHNPERALKWVTELAAHDVGDLESLEMVARGRKWDDLEKAVSPMLGTVLDNWHVDCFNFNRELSFA